MFKLLRKIKGQSTLEYAILIIIIIGALLSIQFYIKRGLQGRLRQASDDIGDQYSPGNTNVTRNTTTVSNSTETYITGVQNSVLRAPETTSVNATQTIINLEQEFWGKTP